jgi:hypothetical protein
MSYGVETDANALFTVLTADDTVTLPTIDLISADYELPTSPDMYLPIPKLTNADLTTKMLDGTGTFDVLMASYSAQLKEEYKQTRISGAEYTKAYIAMTQNAMQFAVTFLLGRDQAYWQSVQAQVAAITARVALETAKLAYAEAELQVQNAKATYALTKAKLATEDVQYGVQKYQIDNLLPQQLALAIQQVAQSVAQVALIGKQELLIEEQTETSRAQTMDTRTDGVTPVVGLVGKQKALYAQQVTSYQRDAEVKAAKIFSDAWITMLTINESIPVPTSFDNTNLDDILGTIKTNNAL